MDLFWLNKWIELYRSILSFVNIVNFDFLSRFSRFNYIYITYDYDWLCMYDNMYDKYVQC